MNIAERFHGRYVHPRRAQVLSGHLAELIPQDARVLDVGSGDGLLAHLIQKKRPDIDITGIDVMVRQQTYVPIHRFNGKAIPNGDASLDVVMFVDVLHHMEDPMVLLREGVRTARKAIVIKDHTLNGVWAGPTLRFMDRVGNARHGVNLPHTYWSKQKWFEACQTLGLKITVWKGAVDLYPWPANWIFGRSLHFVARLDVT